MTASAHDYSAPHSCRGLAHTSSQPMRAQKRAARSIVSCVTAHGSSMQQTILTHAADELRAPMLAGLPSLTSCPD